MEKNQKTVPVQHYNNLSIISGITLLASIFLTWIIPFAVLLMPLSLVLSIISLKQISKNNQLGKTLSIVVVIVSALFTAFAAFGAIWTIMYIL